LARMPIFEPPSLAGMSPFAVHHVPKA